jgi:AraC-like DNA-binding protein
MTSKQQLTPEQTQARLKDLRIDEAPHVYAAFEDDYSGVSYALHAHTKHQLLYAVTGVARIESLNAQYLLPPQRAAWIPAGVSHATHLETARTISLFFANPSVKAGAELAIIEAPPVLREMILYARRWSLLEEHLELDAAGARFFPAIALLVEEQLSRPEALSLPLAKSETTQRAISYVMNHPDVAGIEELATHCGVGARTLRRRLSDEMGIGFRELLCQVRVHLAGTQLGQTADSVSRVAMSVGFSSPSAFAQTFQRVTGISPSEFRKRLT